MSRSFRLISHNLCPYVQRAVIVATEKGIAFERVDIDLRDKPDWFLKISPTGKTPLLEVIGHGKTAYIFESAVIAEFLDEVSPGTLLPADPVNRARHRAWVEFASATLGSIGQLYLAAGETQFGAARAQLRQRLEHVEQEVTGPWFAGEEFGLVDAAFGPAFRYLDVFNDRAGLDLLAGLPSTAEWAARLAGRQSVQRAVSPNYPDLLVDFVRNKGSHLGGMLGASLLAA